MEAKSQVKYVRISPRKVRPVIDLIRNKPAHKAVSILMNVNKKAARLTEKVLKSAIANAEVKKMDTDNLIVSEVRADGGPMLKRFMSRSMGRANRILKRTSHITIKVKEAAKPASKDGAKA